MADENFSAGLVSIVIPTFNQASYLAEALTSVTKQTYNDWEAIVVNNFSTDETSDLVLGWDDSRVRLVNFANNGIIAESRNLAISQARGEFIAFLDSDDTWEESKLSKSVDVLRAGSDLVCHAERWFGGGTRDRVVRYGPASRSTYDSLLLDGNCISTSAVVVRHDVLERVGKFRTHPNFVTTEDYDLWLRISQGGYKISFIDEVLGSFRRHASSASSATTRHLQAELAVLEDHFAKYPTGNTRSFTNRKALAHYTAGRSFSKSSKFREACGAFLTSLKMNPLHFRTWIGLCVCIAEWLMHPVKRRGRG